VLIDGRDVREVTLASLRSQIGVVLQDALLFSGSVRDNIAYGHPEASLERIKEAAHAAQAAEFIEGLPNGYDTIVVSAEWGSRADSGSEWPSLEPCSPTRGCSFLDDSTSAVDVQTEAAIQGALDRLMRDKRRTAIVIASGSPRCAMPI